MSWLDEREEGWKARVRFVAIDPCASYRSAVEHALPHARVIADHFHLDRLAGEMVTDVGGNPVFTPIDQHGYPALDRALAPTSLARLAAGHLDGRRPPRRIMAPTPCPAGPAAPPGAPPPPPPAPSVATLQAVHRHALGNQDDLADVAPLGDEAVGVGRPVEREGLGNDWLQLSLLERRYQRLNHPVEASLGVPPGEHVEAKDALVLVHHP